ncbi:hypothetical protein ABH930_007237 [Kitasatospora sp. GAS204A]|nr:hypothetical protein [Kitasatospora sp. GAS204B]
MIKPTRQRIQVTIDNGYLAENTAANTGSRSPQIIN